MPVRPNKRKKQRRVEYLKWQIIYDIEKSVQLKKAEIVCRLCMKKLPQALFVGVFFLFPAARLL